MMACQSALATLAASAASLASATSAASSPVSSEPASSPTSSEPASYPASSEPASFVEAPFSPAASTDLVASKKSYFGLSQEELIRALRLYNEGLSLGKQQNVRYLMEMKNTFDGLAVEGLLKLHWGVKSPIRLEKNDEAAPIHFKRSFTTRQSRQEVIDEVQRDSCRKRQSLYRHKRHAAASPHPYAATSLHDAAAAPHSPVATENGVAGDETDSASIGAPSAAEAKITTKQTQQKRIFDKMQTNIFDSLPKNFRFKDSQRHNLVPLQEPSLVSSLAESTLNSSSSLTQSPHNSSSSSLNSSSSSLYSSSSNSSLFSLESLDSTSLDGFDSADEALGMSTPRPRSRASLRSLDRDVSRRKRVSINGHVYREQTRTFVPEYGSVTSVRVHHDHTAEDVVNILREKFRIENESRDFQLYAVKSSGEIAAIADHQSPLITRLRLGPCEAESRIFVMDRDSSEEVTAEVAELLHVPEPILAAMLQRMDAAMAEEMDSVKLVFEKYKEKMNKLIEEIESRVETEKIHWV